MVDWIVGGQAQDALQRLVERDRVAAIAAYLVLTAVGCALLALPGAFFAVVASALFGPFEGTLWCSLATAIGAIGSFLAGRYFLKDAVKPRVMRCAPLRRLLFSGSRRNELLTLAVTRLVPLFPFNLQNLAYGITDVSLSVYAGATFLFIVPGVALYAFGAAVVFDEDNRVICFGIAAALLVSLLVAGMLLRRRTRGAEAAEPLEGRG